MGKSRVELQNIFEDILGSRNVYFQPPENLRLQYPCIIYNLMDMDVQRADNGVYKLNHRYSVTVIDEDPDSEIKEKVITLPYARYDRWYAADDLNHWVFAIYF